jgi:protein TonB
MALTASSQSGSRSTIILVLVIALHIAVFYGIQMGLARKVVQLLPKDIQTKIIKEDKPDEPPPPPPPPPPDIATPPPFVPPPEVSVSVPVQTTAIQTVTTERPPVVMAPVMAPAPVAKDVVVLPTMDRATGDLEQYYPPGAKREGREGSSVVAVYIDAKGRVTDVKVEESSGSPDLDEGAVKFAKTWRFKPQTRNGVAEASVLKRKVTFKLSTR